MLPLDCVGHMIEMLSIVTASVTAKRLIHTAPDSVPAAELPRPIESS